MMSYENKELKWFFSEPLEPLFTEPWKQSKIVNNAVKMIQCQK